MMFEDLTIAIPVRDRQKNLEAQFTNIAGIDCRKLVVDSSESPYEGDIPGDVQYEYIGPTVYHDMRVQLVNWVDTKFMIDCPDDDILMLDTVRQCVDFLREHDSFSVCDGKYVLNRRGDMKYPGKHQASVRIFGGAEYGVVERISFLLKKSYYGRQHSVLRSAAYKEVVRIYDENRELPCHPTSNSPGMDISTNVILAIVGNIRTFNSTYCIRPLNKCARVISRDDVKNELRLGDASMSQYAISDDGLRPIIELLVKYNGVTFDEARCMLRKAYSVRYGWAK